MSEKTQVRDPSTSPPSPPPPPAYPASYYPPRQRKVHDSAVTFEEYHYYAQQTRDEQLLLEAPEWQWRTLLGKKKANAEHEAGHHSGPRNGQLVTDEEWIDASRALRTASWGAVFYLVRKDSEAMSSKYIKANKPRSPPISSARSPSRSQSARLATGQGLAFSPRLASLVSIVAIFSGRSSWVSTPMNSQRAITAI